MKTPRVDFGLTKPRVGIGTDKRFVAEMKVLV